MMAVDQFARILAMEALNSGGKARFTEADKEKLDSITNPIIIKGRVDTVDDLNAFHDAQPGWFYFVGTDGEELQEYVYTASKRWELVGFSRIDLNHCAEKSDIADLRLQIDGNTRQITEIDKKVNANTSDVAESRAILADVANAGRKNLLPLYTFPSKTDAGVTYTVQDDGSVTTTGTASSSTSSVECGVYWFHVPRSGAYVLSGCPAGGGNASYEVEIQSESNVLARDYGEGVTVNLSAEQTYTVKIIVRSGADVTGKIFRPMLCLKPIYELDPSFQPPTMSNAELTQKLNALLNKSV